MEGITPLSPHAWESYYVIVGSTAGALIGLQFVVLTLISESGRLRGSGEAMAAFGSPNVVHFCAALLVAAIFSAPWQDMGAPGIAVAVAGLAGLIYSIAVLRRAMRQRDYKPVLEDWIWHAALPTIAYAALLHAGIRLSGPSTHAPYLVAGSALLLIFIGIHNAWDTVMYVTLDLAAKREARAGSVGAHGRPAAQGATAPDTVGAASPEPPTVGTP